MTEIKFAYVTFETKDRAQKLAEDLVSSGLAACGNIIGPMTSVYSWKGRLCHDEEWLLILKTTDQKVPALIERVRTDHDYDCPCVVILPVEAGNPDFLDWVRSQCSPPTGERAKD